MGASPAVLAARLAAMACLLIRVVESSALPTTSCSSDGENDADPDADARAVVTVAAAIVVAIVMTVVGLAQEEDGSFGAGTNGGLQSGLDFLGAHTE